MAGIEEAFEKFVTRVSGRERSKAEESLSKYKSYSEEELLGNIEAKYPNQLQSFSLEDYQLNTMPNYYNQRYDYENQMPIYQDDRYNIPQQELAYGGLASFANGGLTKPGKVVSKIENPTAGLVFNPGLYEGPYEGPYILGGPRPGQYYQPSPITAIRDSNVIPLNVPGIAPRLETTPQVDVNTNPIAKALEMAGFTREEIMRILGQQGFADGGLTNTIPPVKGPDSQGVESLFRRRYN